MSWAGYREFILDRKVRESPLAVSLYLVPADGKELPPHLPGQHLTFKLEIPGQPKPVTRFYTISDCANGSYYRLTVKKELPPQDHPEAPSGLSSTYLTEKAQPGDRLQAQAPKGDFHLDVHQDHPVVLIAGGIGVTPILSMLNASAAGGKPRDIRFFFGLRNGDDHVFKEHLERLALGHPQIRYTVCYDHVREGKDVHQRDFHYGQHISLALLERELPSLDFEFYLCGPSGMMSDLTAGLREWGVPEGRILTESFGPASKAFAAISLRDEETEPATGAARVTFARSGKTVDWDEDFTSLWEFAEAQGVDIDSGCLFGDCGTCMTRLLSGKVKYNHETVAAPDAGTCLPCSCKPDGPVTLDA